MKAKAAKTAVEKKVNLVKTYEKEFERRVKENEEQHKQDIMERTSKYDMQRDFEQKQKDKYMAKNQYSVRHTAEEENDIDAKLNAEEQKA